jgi:alanyl-tRNA synthetase
MTRTKPLRRARSPCSEKYGDEVRVLSMGREDDSRYYSVECGRHSCRCDRRYRHLQGHRGKAVSGVRRIEALTGEGARQWLNACDEKLRETAAALKASPDEVLPGGGTRRKCPQARARTGRCQEDAGNGGGAKAEAAGPKRSAGVPSARSSKD